MVERKSHAAFYRKPLRIGSAALTLALVTSFAPSITSSGYEEAAAQASGSHAFTQSVQFSGGATTGNIKPTYIPGEKMNGSFELSYEEKLVVPGEETKSDPTFDRVDEDGNPTHENVDVPGTLNFTIINEPEIPEGYVVVIDEKTGVITVTFPDKSKLNENTVEEFKVTVNVAYFDFSVDTAYAYFKLDTDGDGTPDTEDSDDDNDGIPDEKEKEDGTNPKVPNQNVDFEPEYEDGSGKPGEDVTVPEPTIKDKDGNPTEAPEGTTFTPGEDAPEGVTIIENTGEITVTIPEDAKHGDTITVPVVVTYPDKTTDTVEVTVTVEKPDWDDNSGKPGDKVEIPNNGGSVDDGTTVETDGPGTATIDDDGTITVDIDEDANPGDTIIVIIKDQDGNEIDRVTVTVEQPETDDTGSGTTTPGDDTDSGTTTPDDDTDSGTTTPGDGTRAPRSEAPTKRTPLPRTGAEIASAAGAAAALIAAGLGLVFSRRRREGAEN